MQFIRTVDVDRSVQGIYQVDLSQIGSEMWRSLHSSMVNLDSQAIMEEKTNGQRTVAAAILKYNKTGALVYAILSTSVWKVHVLPKIVELSQLKEGIKFINAVWRHESAAVDLLAGALLEPGAHKLVQSELLDLLDYACAGIQGVLNAMETHLTINDFKYDENGMISDEHERDWRMLRFKNGMTCISILKVLTEVNVLETEAAMYLLLKHNLIERLYQLVRASPWQRHTLCGLEIFMGKYWKVYERSFDGFAPQEVHTWLCLYNLITNQQLNIIPKFQNAMRCRLHYLGHFIREVLVVNFSEIKKLQDVLLGMELARPDEVAYCIPLVTVVRREKSMRNSIIKNAQNSPGGFSEIARQQGILIRKNEEKNGSKLNESPLKFCPLDGNVADIKCGLQCDVYYCSHQCQEREWDTHKPHCKAFTYIPIDSFDLD